MTSMIIRRNVQDEKGRIICARRLRMCIRGFSVFVGFDLAEWNGVDRNVLGADKCRFGNCVA